MQLVVHGRVHPRVPLDAEATPGTRLEAAARSQTRRVQPCGRRVRTNARTRGLVEALCDVAFTPSVLLRLVGQYSAADISVAVNTDRGLLTPIVFGAASSRWVFEDM